MEDVVNSTSEEETSDVPGPVEHKATGTSAVTPSRGQRSFVWKHFSEPSPDKKTVCKHCKGSYRFTGGTTNLLNHLKSMHPSVLREADVKIEATAASAGMTRFGTKPIGSFGALHTTRGCSVTRSNQITELVVDWIIGDMRPLGIGNDQGFRNLLRFIEPGYSVPSRTTVANIVRRRHQEAKVELKTKLKEAAAVSLTTDGWTSKAVQSFVTYTIHFINYSWKLESYVLATSHFHGSHTKDNLAAALLSTVDSFGIPRKAVQSIVQDEAANAVAAGKKLHEAEGWESEVCAAHRLQTCIRHAVTNSRPLQKLLGFARRLVTYFNHSSKSLEILHSRQVSIGLRKKGTALPLVQDVPTRWNSSLAMLERLVLLKLPLLATAEDPDTKCDDSMMLKDH